MHKSEPWGESWAQDTLENSLSTGHRERQRQARSSRRRKQGSGQKRGVRTEGERELCEEWS